MEQERIVKAINDRLDREGKLPCAMAFRVAHDLEVEPLLVGRTADEMGVKLNRCQLGMFGYGPKAEGKHKIVKPAGSVSPELEEAIRQRLEEGRISCRMVWEVAAELELPKMDVSAAVEALGIKLVHCQLGAF